MGSLMDFLKNWKLKLRYGRLKTNFRHYTLLADGEIATPNADYRTEVGPAVFGMKVWAPNIDEAVDMIRVIGRHLGFLPLGHIQVYETEPDEPPRQQPHGYHLKFIPYGHDQTQH
jgi:hypothetical protein